MTFVRFILWGMIVAGAGCVLDPDAGDGANANRADGWRPVPPRTKADKVEKLEDPRTPTDDFCVDNQPCCHIVAARPAGPKTPQVWANYFDTPGNAMSDWATGLATCDSPVKGCCIKQPNTWGCATEDKWPTTVLEIDAATFERTSQRQNKIDVTFAEEDRWCTLQQTNRCGDASDAVVSAQCSNDTGFQQTTVNGTYRGNIDKDQLLAVVRARAPGVAVMVDAQMKLKADAPNAAMQVQTSEYTIRAQKQQSYTLRFASPVPKCSCLPSTVRFRKRSVISTFASGFPKAIELTQPNTGAKWRTGCGAAPIGHLEVTSIFHSQDGELSVERSPKSGCGTEDKNCAELGDQCLENLAASIQVPAPLTTDWQSPAPEQIDATANCTDPSCLCHGVAALACASELDLDISR
jgi:hypothetical protein